MCEFDVVYATIRGGFFSSSPPATIVQTLTNAAAVNVAASDASISISSAHIACSLSSLSVTDENVFVFYAYFFLVFAMPFGRFPFLRTDNMTPHRARRHVINEHYQ